MEHSEILSFSNSFTTEQGAVLKEPQIAYKSWGQLNENKDNVIFVCHALTGNTNANEWFGGLIGKDKALNPEKYFIICPNILGSCYGTTGPSSIDPDTGTAYRGHFPPITIRDIVRFNQLLVDHLEVNGIALVIGGSLGGMTALEFSLLDDRVQAAACFVMGKSHSPWAIGISEAQRLAIYADENWKDGFYSEEHRPKKGLAAARAMAMLTYRTPENYDQKFGRALNTQKGIFEVESYLNYQGEKLVHRFDANSYVTLTKAMDSHDVGRGRKSAEEALGKVEVPVLIIGFQSDKLYPIEEQKELASLLPNSTFAELKSPFGHDAFLIEFEQIDQQLKSFLTPNSYTQ